MEQYNLTNEAIDKVSLALEETLGEWGVDARDLLKTRLALEETLLKYQEAFGAKTLFRKKCTRRLHRIRLEFSIPARGLIGYRGEFLTDTKGNGVMNSTFDGYGPYKGDIQYRKQGSLIAFEAGEAITYGLYNAQERGTLFISPGEKVYSGMVVGQNGKGEDIELNVCKKKQLTNTRSSSADEALRLTPPRVLSLEQALEFIDTDELLEITPKSLRIRKKILDPTSRKRAAMRAASLAQK